MSTPHPHFPPAPARESVQCMCEHGNECTSFAPGHAIRLIQSRLAAATPSEWIDAIVETADHATGILVLRSLADGTTVEVWNGFGAAEVLRGHTPVALHARYHVLAAGTARFNVEVRRSNAAQPR